MSRIDTLGLSTRAVNALGVAGITTVDDLVACEARDLLDLRCFGAGCLAEVEAALAARGLGLREPGRVVA